MIKHFYVVKNKVIQSPYVILDSGTLLNLASYCSSVNIGPRQIKQWAQESSHGESMSFSSSISLLCVFPESFKTI